MLGLIERHAIDCDLRLTGASGRRDRASDMPDLEAEAECLASVMDYRDVEILSATQARAAVDTPYHGALDDRLGGHMHPLNYTLGLARATAAAGVTIHENSVAVQPRPQQRHQGRHGQRRGARQACRAGRRCAADRPRAARQQPHHAGRQLHRRDRTLPDASAIIPSNAAVSDTRFVVNYYRLSADGRLLFGGGERYTPAPPADIPAFVRPHLEKTFPQLKGRRIDYAWGGLVSVTTSRLPHVGRIGEVYFAHGYSGKGVILSTLSGKLLAEAISGETARFDLFAGDEPDAVSRAARHYAVRSMCSACCGTPCATGSNISRVQASFSSPTARQAWSIASWK